MMTDRFEAWWPTNPARLLLSAEAKEVARRVWHAARADMVAEMQEAVAQAPDPSFKEMADALWVSQLGVIQPDQLRSKSVARPDSMLARLCAMDTEEDDTVSLAQQRLPWAATRGKGTQC